MFSGAIEIEQAWNGLIEKFVDNQTADKGSFI